MGRNCFHDAPVGQLETERFLVPQLIQANNKEHNQITCERNSSVAGGFLHSSIALHTFLG